MKNRKNSLRLKLMIVVWLLLFMIALPVLNSVVAAEVGEAAGYTHNLFSVILYSLVYLLLFIFFLVMIFLMRARGKRAVFIVCLVGWILLGTYVVVQGLHVSKDLAYSVSVEHAQYETEPFEPYVLSADQQGVIAEFGNPHGFVILFATQGRQETWFYYDEGLVLDFLGGIEIQRAPDKTLVGLSTARTPYAPHNFTSKMTPGTALSVAELDRFLVDPLQDELVENGTLYFGEGIALGFVDDGLCYVETFISKDE
ncbi:MAG: hypothetical protein SCM11_06525 [Bacillota bacterium]|nr:hypothetical protein [Bacillota bacterium]